MARGLGASVPADGCSAPYQAGVTFASFLFGTIALFLTEGVVRRRHGPAIGLLVAFGLWTATPLSYDATMRDIDPSRESLNSAVALQDLRFERRSP